MISINTRQAYTEVDNFLKLIDEEDKNKVPNKLREIFKKEKDHNYEKFIDINKAISEQNLKEETLSIIAILNLQYWCNDEHEKERLKQKYIENEKKYEKVLKDKYDTNNLFKKNIKQQINERNSSNNQTDIVKYRESIFRRFIIKVKKLFHV